MINIWYYCKDSLDVTTNSLTSDPILALGAGMVRNGNGKGDTYLKLI